MSEKRCKNCLSTDLRASRPQWWDLLGLNFIARPVRCHHCSERQYVPANRMTMALAASFHRIDAGIDHLHPDAIRHLISEATSSHVSNKR